MNQKKTDIIVALDVQTLTDAVKLIEALGDSVEWYKVGSVLYASEGQAALAMLKKYGKKIFLDLKFHDIPNTVADAVENSCKTGVNMFTLHASGGSEMIKAAISRAGLVGKKYGIAPPLAVAVTVLTSFSQQQLLEDFGMALSAEDIVKKLVALTIKSGGKCVVASPRELPILRAEFGNEITIITPGIRPLWSAANDQNRITTPEDAVRNGADFIVIGRPIIAASNPREAALKILEEIHEVQV
ncbi:orotidine-5'-phosphate decarboxylase [bacterium]|nr:orotidine-5'-phosphate decarboxylase [bacterium]